MINYIVLGLTAAIFVLSIICVIAELVIPRRSAVGSFFRKIRIQLRTKSRTSLCVFAIVILIFGLAAHDSEMRLIFAMLLIMLLTLMVLHPEDFLSIFRQRKKAKKQKLLPLAATVGELPEARVLPEPEEINSEVSKG